MSTTMKVRPKTLTIEMSDGTKIVLPFADWKPSKASQRPNANAIDKRVVDGHLVQIGCNLTVLS